MKIKTDIDRTKGSHGIMLFNSDNISFEYVINSLRVHMDYSWEQAEQCAVLVHLRGRFLISQGKYEEMVARSNELASIELDTVVVSVY